jgi:hypothetical protein
VVVPGVGTLDVGSWRGGNESDCWLKLVKPFSIPDVGILVYVHDLVGDGTPSWQHIEEEGGNFLRALYSLTQIHDVRVTPRGRHRTGLDY